MQAFGLTPFPLLAAQVLLHVSELRRRFVAHNLLTSHMSFWLGLDAQADLTLSFMVDVVVRSGLKMLEGGVDRKEASW